MTNNVSLVSQTIFHGEINMPCLQLPTPIFWDSRLLLTTTTSVEVAEAADEVAVTTVPVNPDKAVARTGASSQ